MYAAIAAPRVSHAPKLAFLLLASMLLHGVCLAETHSFRLDASTPAILLPYGQDVVNVETPTGSVPSYRVGWWHGHGILTLVPDGTGLPHQIIVQTRASDTAGHVRPLRFCRKRTEAFSQALPRVVSNPEAAPVYAAKAENPGTGFHPTAYPDLEGSAVEYLILTDDAWVDDFQVLADWKTRRGVPTVVRGVGAVLQSTRQGSDRAETLRHYIQDAYQLWGISYLLLAADSDVIPARFAYSEFTSPPGSVPTDLYYACLDGDWNANGNDLHGEAAQGASDLGDEADLFPELFVSRAPVHDSTEAQLFVQKVIQYETPVETGYQQETLLLAEVLSPADYSMGETIILDGADLTEQLETNSLPGGLSTNKLYETSSMYPGSSPLSKAATLAAMEMGPHFVNHMGHGFRFNMSVGDQSIVNPEAEALLNGDRTFLLFLLNCTALAFDSNSLGEAFLLAPGGGAIGVVGSSREAFPSTSIDYNEDFYNSLFTLEERELGRAVVNARLPSTIFTFFDTADRWTHFILNVLGDAELNIFTEPPIAASVTAPDSIGLGTTSLTVDVDAGGAVEAARVCLWKGDETYAVGFTDSTGQVQLPIRPDTPGSMLLTVSGVNLQTFLGSVQVTSPLPASPYVLSSSVVDDGSGSSQGNGDARIDAGETVELVITVANSGGTSANDLLATLTVPDSVTAVTDSLLLGDLAPSDSLSQPTLQGHFVLEVAPNLSDQALLEFSISFFDSASTALGSENLRKRSHAPQLEFVELLRSPTFSKSASEDLLVVLKNFGSGQSTALAGSLRSLDLDVTVTQPNTSLVPLASFQADTTQVALQVVETNESESNALQLDFDDTYGRTWSYVFDLRGPQALTSPSLDASPGPTQMKVSWSVSPDTLLLGYHVYRKLVGAPAFQRVTPDFLTSAFLLDGPLLPNTGYEYAVSTLNLSRLESDLSPVAQGSTNPPQVAGWPLPMATPTSSSVAVGDIDGDGFPEIVAGSSGLYAWHADAQELQDGDANALTWGILASEIFTITASVALVDADTASAGLEIVAAAWDDNRLFLYDGAGVALPGWPVEPLSGGSQGYWGAPTAADIDGDGLPEILAISKSGHLFGYHHDGTPMFGAEGDFGSFGVFTRSSVSVVNLDGDADLEILLCGADGFLHAFNADGSSVGGNFPINLGAFTLASPSVGEIDGDASSPEIVVTSENDLVHVFDTAGNAVSGWPKGLEMSSASFGPSPALGDLNGDERMEIAVVSNTNPGINSQLVVYDGATGSILLQKNLGDQSESSPILADLDGNGSVDVLVGGEAGVIRAWDLNGNTIAGFPLTVGDFVRGTPQFTDVDLDGDAELVFAGWDRNVYVWDLPGAYDAALAPWPMFGRDVQRTSSGAMVDPPTDSQGRVLPQRFALFQNAPNPFNPVTTIRFALPRRDRVEVDIFDVRGRHLRSLRNADFEAGVHEVTWDGRDGRGRSLASGLYWYRVRTSATQATRKMLLMK